MGASGTTEIDFGAFPGRSSAKVLVVDASILANSLVEAWLVPADTVDHSSDEHLVDPIRLHVEPPLAGIGFLIYGAPHTAIPVDNPKNKLRMDHPIVYGKWNVGYVWI